MEGEEVYDSVWRTDDRAVLCGEAAPARTWVRNWNRATFWMARSTAKPAEAELATPTLFDFLEPTTEARSHGEEPEELARE